MARPENWREIVAEHGWGTAPRRIKRRTRINTATGCIEWTGPLTGSVPQIRISVGGSSWAENAARVAWALRYGQPAGDDVHIKRTCCNKTCVSHLAAARPSVPASVCEYRNIREAAFRQGVRRRKLTAAQAQQVRDAYNRGDVLAPIARKMSVTPAAVYAIAKGFSYRKNAWDPMPERDNGTKHASAELVEEILRRVSAGEAKARLAVEYGRSKAGIDRICRHNGPDANRARAKEMRRRGTPVRKIAARLGISESTVYRLTR